MAKPVDSLARQSQDAGCELYRTFGGASACRELSVAFYARVKRDPVLRPFFPGKTMTCAIEEFAAFLAQFLGGPVEDAQRRWWLSLRESHLRFKIGPKERAAWINNMARTLDEIRIEEPIRATLREFFEQSSAYIVNTEGGSPDVGKPVDPRQGTIRHEIARRWDAQRELDKAVAAVRSRDAELAIMLAESSTLQSCFERNRSLLVGLLGAMIASRNDALMQYIQDKIIADSDLAQETYAGRTLLHEASARGSLAVVKLLLSRGADPNVTDGGGHAPLYSLANECANSGGGRVVRVLAEAGANVNADGGVKRCTALHMAARRGNVEVAEALLECGADIEARDSLGDTPLRRAVNCNKPRVAAQLLKLGAHVHSIGSKGLTPLLAARTSVMQELLQSQTGR